MALTLTVKSIDRSQRMIRLYGTIAVGAGNYATGGLTLTFAGIDRLKTHALPSLVTIQSMAGAGASGWEYSFAPGTTLANGKMQIFGQQPTSGTASVIALSEFPDATAIPAGVTGDTIVIEAVFFNTAAAGKSS